MALTKKQRVFIDEYVKCWNASEAARRAGYSKKTACAIGCENLTKPEIMLEIDIQLENRVNNTSEEFEALVRGYAANRRNNKSNNVYLIQAENGLTKIGVSNDAYKRLKTLDVGSPVNLELLFYFNTDEAMRIEGFLHNKFAKKLVKGEWYNLSCSDIKWIKENYDTF